VQIIYLEFKGLTVSTGYSKVNSLFWGIFCDIWYSVHIYCSNKYKTENVHLVPNNPV